MNWHKVRKVLPDFLVDDRKRDDKPSSCARCYVPFTNKSGILRLYHGSDENTYIELCSACSELYDKEYKQFRELFLKGSGPKLYCYACNDLMGENEAILHYWGNDTSNRNKSNLCNCCSKTLQRCRNLYTDQWFENHKYKPKVERAKFCCACKVSIEDYDETLCTHPFDTTKLFCIDCGKCFRDYLTACKKKWLGGA